MRCFESPSGIQSSSWTRSQFVSWKDFRKWETNVTWTWIFVLKGRRGNALCMAGQVSPAVCCSVGSQLPFFRIKLLLQKFFKGVLKVSMSSCAVLNRAFGAQLGCWAGAPVAMFTLGQRMWLPGALTWVNPLSHKGLLPIRQLSTSLRKEPLHVELV